MAGIVQRQDSSQTDQILRPVAQVLEVHDLAQARQCQFGHRRRQGGDPGGPFADRLGAIYVELLERVDLGVDAEAIMDAFALGSKRMPYNIKSPEQALTEWVSDAIIFDWSAGDGLKLYTRAVLPFEIASVLLLMAIVGAVLLARDRKQEETYD